MGRARREEEIQLLEQVARYKDEYRSARAAAVNEERARRHMDGEAYIVGSWVPRADVWRVDRGLQRHERLAFFEIVVFLVLLAAIALGLWIVFAFLLLP